MSSTEEVVQMLRLLCTNNNLIPDLLAFTDRTHKFKLGSNRIYPFLFLLFTGRLIESVIHIRFDWIRIFLLECEFTAPEVEIAPLVVIGKSISIIRHLMHFGLRILTIDLGFYLTLQMRWCANEEMYFSFDGYYFKREPDTYKTQPETFVGRTHATRLMECIGKDNFHRKRRFVHITRELNLKQGPFYLHDVGLTDVVDPHALSHIPEEP